MWINEKIRQCQEGAIKGFPPAHSDFTTSAVSIWACNSFLTFRFIECQWLVAKQENVQIASVLQMLSIVGDAVLRLTTK